MEVMWRKAGLVEVEESTITTRFESANLTYHRQPFLNGDDPPGQMVTGLMPEQRGTLERQLRHVFLSGRPGWTPFLYWRGLDLQRCRTRGVARMIFGRALYLSPA